MELVLTRDDLQASRTLGKLYVDNVFLCYTCEDTVREHGVKIPKQTAIPAGRYELIINISNRFKRELPLLLNVPMFEGIRIHPGNTEEDSEGCILVGMMRSDRGVQKSAEAMARLMTILRGCAGKINITVR